MSNAFDYADTRTLIQHALAIQFAALPAQTIEHTKLFLADTMGVALAGHQGNFSQALIAHCRNIGGTQQARVIGSTLRLPAAHAAMINAYLIHCLEFDCVHEPAVVHPMAVIAASLLAYCDDKPVTNGADLLAALVAAVDVAATLGCASRSKLRFFRPAQCGALGAAVGIAKLAGWNIDQTLNLLGIVLGQLSGTMQAHREGKASLPMQIAVNARNVLSAFEFATMGLHGPMGAIEGEFGYLNLFESAHDFPAAVQHRLYQASVGQFAIDEVSHKPFPSGRATHGGLHALEILCREHAFAPYAITHITLHAPPLICQLVDRPMTRDASSNYLRLCFPFCAALLLRTGEVSPLAFKANQDEAFYALASKIRVLQDSNPDVNALRPIRLEVQTADQRFEQTISHVLGSPLARLSAAAHTEKLLRNIQLLDARNAAAMMAALHEAIDVMNTQPARGLLDVLESMASLMLF